MAAGVRHLLRISCSVCIVLHLCLEGGVNGDVQVPDGVVYTELQRTAEIGKSLVLTCRFYGTPIAVYWKKGVDPTTAPNLITWVEGESASGSCVHDKSCNITGDYSLVIRSVKVSDQGSYICRISNYLGVLIHNFTEVTVFAAPSEPYPLIEECQHISNGPQSCRLQASDTVTLTCTASNYFPDIDLFFIHESITTNATYSQISEETNVDLTKNKSVSIVARPSEKPYVCVASRIPGPQDRRTVSVIVHLPESTVAMTTAPSNQTLSNGQVKAEKIVIPIVVILIAIVIFIFIWWRMKKCKTGVKRDPESMPLHERPQINGKLSFFEMWYLVQNMDETDINKIAVNLTAGGDDNQTACSRLCQWKDTNTLDNEALGLKNVLVGHVGEEPWRDLCERRYDTTSSVSKERLDYILWWIVENKDVAEVTHFLNELIPDFILKATPLVSPGEKHHVVGMVEDGRKVLSTWREGDHTTSQVIQLSLALEMAKCKPVDRTFFMVPEHLLKEISPQEVEGFVYRLGQRHSWRLATDVNIKNKNEIYTIIDGNKDELLIIEQMINDWLVEQRCSNYEKRCKLDDAVIKIGRLDMADVFGTTSYRERSEDGRNSLHNDSRRFDYSSTFDDDIESLVKDLPTRAIPSFLQKLGIQSEHDDIDIQKSLRCWRDGNLSTPEGCSLQHLATIYRETLLETNCDYAFILNDDDLENVVASVTSQKQIEELTKKLGIKHAKAERSPLENLKQWRDKSEHKERRKKLKKALHDIELSGSIADRLPEKFVYQVEFVRLAWAMFSADVSPLVTTLGMEMGKRTSQPRGTVDLLSRLFKKSDTIIDAYPRRDFCIALRKLGYHDVARMSYYGFDASLSELCNMALGLSEQEILKVGQHLELVNDSFLVSDGGYDIVTFMEIWKGQHSAEPVHYRLKLALGLRAAEKTELARKILAGDYGTVAVNHDVVKSICNGMGNGQLERLAEHLGLNAKGDNPIDTLALVIQWATGWFSKFDNSSFFDKIKEKLFEVESRKEYIDNLYKAGFVRFAEELMLLEVSRLRPVKQVTDEPCENENQQTPEQNVHENNPPIDEVSEATAFSPSTDGQDPPSNSENEEMQV